MRVVYGEHQTGRTYVSLFIVVIGVAIASMTELEFDLAGVFGSLISTVVLVIQNILSKKLLSTEGVAAPVMQAYLNATSCITLVVLIALFEPTSFVDLVAVMSRPPIAFYVALNGLCFFLHVSLALRVLEQVSALTYAVGNNVKRLFVIVASVIVFRSDIAPLNALGVRFLFLQSLHDVLFLIAGIASDV